MSKEELRKISQTFALSENEQNQRDQTKRQLIIDEENRKKTEEERLLATNLKRLKKTGIVDLFEEIKEEGLNGKSFNINYSQKNTEIKLTWDDYHCNGVGNVDDSYGWKELNGHIDNQDRLYLHKIIWSDGGHEYFGPYTLVENNLVELVGKKLGENKDNQPQPQKRSFLDRILGK